MICTKLFMKMYGIDYEITKYINETALNPDKERNEKASMQINISTKSKADTIFNFSEASEQVQRAKKVIDFEPGIRLEKVRALREEIKRGAYEIDYDKIAENMLGVFIDEIAGSAAPLTVDFH